MPRGITPQTHYFRGKWRTVIEIAAMTGIKERTIHRRISLCLPIDGTPRYGPEAKRWNYRGEMLTIAEIMERTGLSRATVSRRMSGQTFLEGEDLKDRHHEPKKTDVILFHEGEAKTVSAWARDKRINVGTLHSRVTRGLPAKHALQPVPVRIIRCIDFGGHLLTITEWTKKLGFSKSTILRRIDEYGWSIERALTEGPKVGRRTMHRGVGQNFSTSRKDRRGSIAVERADFKIPIETKFAGGEA